MLGQFGRLRREEFELHDVEYEQLMREVAGWRERALELARCRQLRQERGLDLGRGL